MQQMPSTLVDERLSRVAALMPTHGLDAVLVTPGPDLRYLTGYDAVPLERLTCLVVHPDAHADLVVPRLEALAAAASPAGHLPRHTWGETDDPYALTASLIPGAQRVAVDDHMWAAKVLGLRGAMPETTQVLAGPLLDRLRMVKDADEIAALTRAGAAIDRVHAQVPTLLRAGRTEREVGRDIAELILAEGHVAVDFVIVASGPNGASPHHEVSDRIIESGDAIVIDIGGMMPDGYRSDCTRTYAVGDPGALYRERYTALQTAQETAVRSVRAGMACSSVDTIARDVLVEAGLGELFVHRTGHGIGLQTHEAPYIVSGNELPLQVGMAFSVEPGFYDEGRHGARIEDIVVVGPQGPVVLNHGTRDLVMV